MTWIPVAGTARPFVVENFVFARFGSMWFCTDGFVIYMRLMGMGKHGTGNQIKTAERQLQRDRKHAREAAA